MAVEKKRVDIVKCLKNGNAHTPLLSASEDATPVSTNDVNIHGFCIEGCTFFFLHHTIASITSDTISNTPTAPVMQPMTMESFMSAENIIASIQ